MRGRRDPGEVELTDRLDVAEDLGQLRAGALDLVIREFEAREAGRVLTRRYERALREGGDLPDLIVIDGGRWMQGVGGPSSRAMQDWSDEQWEAMRKR